MEGASPCQDEKRGIPKTTRDQATHTNIILLQILEYEYTS